jgi:LacI family transcriptional regulator
VLHGQDRVRESTRTRVREVIDQLGYVPDGAAQSLSRRRKEIVGFVCLERETKQNDLENMNLLYYDEIVRGAATAIRERGWSLLIHYVRGKEEWDSPRLQSLTGKVDGLMMVEGVIQAPLLRRLAQRVPVVVIGGATQERALDVVAVDNRAGSAALITHLVADHGRRRLFHVDGPPHVEDVELRRLALHEVVRAHPDSKLVGSYPGVFSVQSGVNAGEILLARRDEGLPDAVVCARRSLGQV